MERHYKSEEFMTINRSIIIPFAKHKGMDDDEIPNFNEVDAFLLNRHKALLLGQVFGTGPMPVEGTTSIICVFETVLEKQMSL